MNRNLGLELIRATEAAALAAAHWMGKGDALSADQAAVNAMHKALSAIEFSGTVALGEGEPAVVRQLHHGERVGADGPGEYDLALDALECTRSVAFGRSNAMAVIALAPHNHFRVPLTQYLDKLAVGPAAAGVIDLKELATENLRRIARAKECEVRDLTVVMLDRERHRQLIEEVRAAGAKIHLIPDGDVAAAIAAATTGSGIDVLMGIGGSSAGVLAAAALRCLGGEIQTRPVPFDRREKEQLRERGFDDLNRIYTAADLVQGDDVMFAATGITDGDVLNGVRFRPGGAATHSLVTRSRTRTRRYIVTEHFFDEPTMS